MDTIKHCLLLLAVFCCCSFEKVSAQTTADATHWKYEVRKKGGNEYDLIFHLTLDQGWHIWSLAPGGDGFQIVPSFHFDENNTVQLVGMVAEKGKPTKAAMEGIEGEVIYMSHKVDYIQTIKVSGATTITGTHEYQVCTDKMCLPPQDRNFSFDIQP